MATGTSRCFRVRSCTLGASWMCLASATIRTTFTSSDGCTDSGPISSQRLAPPAERPPISTQASTPQPPA